MDGRRSLMLGFAVHEVEPAHEWLVVLPMVDGERILDLLPDPDAQYEPARDDPILFGLNEAHALRSWRLKSIEKAASSTAKIGLELKSGRIVYDSDQVNVRRLRDFEQGVRIFPEVGEPDLADLSQLNESHRAWWYSTILIPEFLVQLLHVVGCRMVEHELPRPERRRFARKFRDDPPSLYWVDLAGASERESGTEDWHYRHRWLVRGHYRRDPRGGTLIEGKGICVWVRPYIKGPAGAPWKGRPVYSTAKLEEIPV